MDTPNPLAGRLPRVPVDCACKGVSSGCWWLELPFARQGAKHTPWLCIRPNGTFTRAPYRDPDPPAE